MAGTDRAAWEALPQTEKNLWMKREAENVAAGGADRDKPWVPSQNWQILYAKSARLAGKKATFEAGQTPEELARSEAINVASREATEQRAEEFRAADEERKMQENVQLTPGEPAGTGGTRAATPEEIALHQKIIAGTAARRDYEAAGVGFPESKAIDRVVPGETDFQRERRISDEQARQRQLINRDQDRKFFEQIEIDKREAELKQREEDALFYRRLEAKKRDREVEARQIEADVFLLEARRREELRIKQREEDSEYYDKIAEDNRKRELEYRKEDEEYWDNLRKRREEDDDGGIPAPSPPGTPTPTPTPSGTTRTYKPPSALGFGLLKTSGGFTDEEEEKKKKKKK